MPAKQSKYVQVVLRQDVKTLGKTGEVVNVSQGYARNFLLPGDRASVATPAIVKQIADAAKRRTVKAANAKADLEKLAESLKGKTVTLRVKAGEKGKLFGSVTSKDVTEALKEQHTVKLSPSVVALAEPLKLLGKHTVKLKFSPEVTGELTVQITSSKS